MRETRPSGSEGGETELNRSSLPLSAVALTLPILRVKNSSGLPYA